MPKLLVNLFVAIALIVCPAAAVTSLAADPALPPGMDPGGVPVALISKGVDYTDPQIAAHLARDGEGQMIGWDFIDNDIKPFSNDPEATALAKLLLASSPGIRLVIVRIDTGDPRHLALAASFVARTPARIAAVPHAGENADAWVLFSKAAYHASNTLFIVSAGREKIIPHNTSKLSNMVSVATLGSRLAWKQQGGINVDASVDLWVVPTGASKDESHVNGPPTANTQAAVMAASAVACTDAAKSRLTTAKAFRDGLLAQKRPLAHDPETTVLDPTCITKNAGSGK